MRELRMVNGEPRDADRIPWCPECEAFAVPTDDGTCGKCGTEVVLRNDS